MRILITGASGFVGGNLMRVLRDHELTGVDLRADHTPWGPVLDCDILDRDSLRTIMQRSKPDVCIHAASLAHARLVPNRARAVILGGTENVAEEACAAGVGRFLYFSTVKVYGEVTGAEGVDEDQTPQPASLYGNIKLEAERRAQAICSEHAAEMTCLRPAAIFGPGDRKGNYAKMIRAIRLLGFPLIDGGRARRSIAYVESVADKVRAVVEQPVAGGTRYVLADAIVTVREFAVAARAHFGRRLLLPVPRGALVTAARGLERAVDRLARRDLQLQDRVAKLSEHFVVRAWRFERDYPKAPVFDLSTALERTCLGGAGGER